MRRKLLITALISSLVLGACGVKGQLKTPPPLWGDKAKQEYEEKYGKKDDSAKDESQDQSQDNPDN